MRDVRSEIPALAAGTAFLDGAGGTQVPQPVIDAIAAALRDGMSNVGGRFAASARSNALVDEARHAIADLTGGDPRGVVLGPNMTTLTFHLADALGATWGPGDEVVVTSLDHDANVRPWVLAAEHAGATVRWAEVDPATGELTVDAVRAVVSTRTKLVAVTAASNAIGTKPDIGAIATAAHEAGALIAVDGVHAASHGPVDVAGIDVYALSTYKLCGPHAGALVADPALLERLRPPKLAPSPDDVPMRFERGTPALELLAGVAAAVDWLATLDPAATGSRRERVVAGMRAAEHHTHALLAQLLEGLDPFTVLPAPQRRTSTVSFVVEGVAPGVVAAALAARDVSVWSGDYYAYELMRRFRRPDGAVRASIVLYNDTSDVERLVAGLTDEFGG